MCTGESVARARRRILAKVSMAHDNRRSERVAEAIRIEVATFLTEGAKDPRIVGFVTVTGVEVTHDLRHAKVFVSVMGTEKEQRTTLEGLASLAPHLRSRLSRSLALRFAPELEFRHDPSVERAARIETLLAQVKSERIELAEEAREDADDGAADAGDSTD
jgi:ribosome-binding factor A